MSQAAASLEDRARAMAGWWRSRGVVVHDGALAASLELAAYRVVQEALTNAVKHAPGRRTVVCVRYGEELSIDVRTDGPVIPPGSFAPGRGLTGLRERVSRCGGELTAGGLPGGGFSVRARMPSRARA